MNLTTEQLKQLNDNLGKLDYMDPNKFEFLEKIDIRKSIQYSGYGVKGDQNEYSKVYKHIKSGLYIKIIYYTDSYGDGSYISGIAFVQPTLKTITTFEKI